MQSVKVHSREPLSNEDAAGVLRSFASKYDVAMSSDMSNQSSSGPRQCAGNKLPEETLFQLKIIGFALKTSEMPH